MSETTRRNLLAGAAGVGAAAVLAACGGNASDSGAGQGTDTNTGGQSAPTTAAGGQAGGGALAKTSEIPVGGGKVIAAHGVVVTQPAAGQFKAFSARCTHAGCMVNTVANGTINCPCHGSKFSAADGSVKAGPAPTGLSPKNVTVQGGEIVLA